MADSGFNAERPLTDGRQRKLHRKDLRDLLCQAHPFDPCQGKHDSVELQGIELFQTGLQVPPERDHLEIGSEMKKLGLPSQAAGSDLRPLREVLETGFVSRDKHIPRIFSFRDDREMKPLGKLRWNILHAVDGEVDAPIEQGFFDLLHEEPFPPDLGQWNIQDLVPHRLDLHQGHGEMGMGLDQPLFHPPGLVKSQRTSPGSNSDFARVHSLRAFLLLLQMDLRMPSGSLPEARPVT